MEPDYVSVFDFAEEVGVPLKTMYRYLQRVPVKDKKRVRRQVYYNISTLNAALRAGRFRGVKDIQSKLDVSIRPLAPYGFPGYFVSNAGVVFVDAVTGTRRVPSRTRPDGYRIVDMGAFGTQYVHRLVAAAWLGAPFRSDQQVDHLNGKRDDNRLSNLRWLSGAENVAARDRRNYPSNRRPHKYNSGEISQLHGAFARKWTYSEFRSAYPKVEISSTHYGRLRDKFGPVGEFPVWWRVPLEKRLRIANGYVSGVTYDRIASFVAHLEKEHGWREHVPDDYPTALQPEEFAMIASWVDYHNIADDRRAHAAALTRYLRLIGQGTFLADNFIAEGELYQAKLRDMLKRDYRYNHDTDAWRWVYPKRGRVSAFSELYQPAKDPAAWAKATAITGLDIETFGLTSLGPSEVPFPSH